jgi:prevent-host-death family protein
MTSVGVHEAKTHLSRLLRRVQAGEEIEITSSGKAVARLVPVAPAAVPRVFGFDAAILDVPDDFDAPLPDDIVESFS